MDSTRHKRLAFAVAAFLLLFWSPAVFAPFWQDDFGCMLHAREAAAQGKSWAADFTKSPDDCFWRPMKMLLYWRPLQALGGNPVVAHCFNLLLLLASSAAVGRLTATLLGLRFPKTRFPDADPALGGVAAMLFYGVHNVQFLPVAWACVVQDPMFILFAALCLHFWLVAISTGGRRGAIAAVAVFPCAVAAMSCKEVAIVLPALAAVLAVWVQPPNRPFYRLPKRAWLLGVLLAGATGLWWIVHQRMTVPPPDEYRMRFGMNLLRNGTCLSLFLFEVPREAIRFAIEKHSAIAAVWGAACFATAFSGFIVLICAVRGRMGRRDDLCVLAFVALGFGPHLPPAWNCYEYYAGTALAGFAIFVGMASHRPRRLAVALLLLLGASTLAVAGNYLLPYPAVLAARVGPSGNWTSSARCATPIPENFSRRSISAWKMNTSFTHSTGPALPTRSICAWTIL